MGRRALVVLAAGGASLALAACSLLTGLDADYTMAPELDARRDGDIDEGDGGVDAASDRVSPDDARAAVDAGPFCDQHRTDPGLVFCTDFEKNLTVPANGFDDTGMDEGSYDVSAGIGVGGSVALRARAIHPLASSNVYFRKVFDEGDGGPPPFDRFDEHELSFAFASPGPTTLYTAVLGALGFGAASSPDRIGFSVYRGTAGTNSFDVAAPFGVNGAAAAVPFGAWRRARISFKRSGPDQPYQTVVQVMGLDGSDPSELYSAPAFSGKVLKDGGTGPAQILLGAFFTSKDDGPEAGPDGGVTTLLDDVLYRRLP